MIKLISVTPAAEKTIGYIARVSNPNNQENPKVSGLLKYCIKHGHWSVFEQAHMTVEINTTRAIAAQILRHRSFTFQEFSQRYAESSAMGEAFTKRECRLQDTENRQNSIEIENDPSSCSLILIVIEFHSSNKAFPQIVQYEEPQYHYG